MDNSVYVGVPVKVRHSRTSGGPQAKLLTLQAFASYYALHSQPLEAPKLSNSTGHARGPGVAPGIYDPKSHP